MFCHHSMRLHAVNIYMIHMKAPQFHSNVRKKERHSWHLGKMDITFALCNLYFYSISVFLSMFFHRCCFKRMLYGRSDLLHLLYDPHISLFYREKKHTYSFAIAKTIPQSNKTSTNLCGFTYENIIKNKMTVKLLNIHLFLDVSFFSLTIFIFFLIAQPIDMHMKYISTFDCSC